MFGVPRPGASDRKGLAPVEKFCFQPRENFSLFASEVGGFARIGGEVVKLRAAAVFHDQKFPIAVADGEVGEGHAGIAGPVRRTNPEEGFGAGLTRFAEDGVAEIFAVEIRVCGKRCAGDFGDARKQIHACDDGSVVHRAARSWSQQAGTPSDEWFADAAFVEITFETTKDAG